MIPTNKIRLSAQEIYRKLIEDSKILEVQGQISFTLADVDIVVRQKDVVGNIMQEWLQGWLDSQHIDYALSDNTQMPPDFYLNPEDQTQNLLEVKAFNRSASPGFDIADFTAYQRELLDKPYTLHVDYLIFGYEMSPEGKVIIKDVWLKKVWEICRRMSDWPLNLQIKKGVVHKIRPCVWYSQSPRNFLPFRSLEHFISAIDETVYRNPNTRNLSGTWLGHFLQAYAEHYQGERLNIPRWSEIEQDYIIN